MIFLVNFSTLHLRKIIYIVFIKMEMEMNPERRYLNLCTTTKMLALAIQPYGNEFCK